MSKCEICGNEITDERGMQIGAIVCEKEECGNTIIDPWGDQGEWGKELNRILKAE